LAQWNTDTWKELCEFVRRDPNDFFSLFALPGYKPEFYLRPYQMYSAFWALTRLIQQDLATYGAILADMMGMGKTAEFWAIVYLTYADIKGGISREEALELPDGPEKKQRLDPNGEYPVGIKWTLTARRLFTRLSRGPVVLIVPADLIAQAQAEFNKYFVRGDPYWNFELFIQHKNWPTHGLHNHALQRLRQKGPKVFNNGIILLIHPAGWTSASFKKLFYVPDDNDKPTEPIQPPSIIGFDEYPAAGGRSEKGPVVESIRQIYENIPVAPYPLFIGMTGAPIYRTVRDLRAFVSIICSHKRFDKEEKQHLTAIQRRRIIEGDEADWQNNDRMMHATRDRITEVAKDHEQILDLCGEQDYESISLLNKWRCAEVGKNNKLTCQGVMIRHMPNDFWPNPEAEKKERLLDLPPLNQKTIFVRQHLRYLDGLRKLAKPVDADATRDYERRLHEWEERGRPEGEKPKKGLPESRYSLNRCAGSWPVLPVLVTDPASGFQSKKPFEASLIREKGWNSKTLTQLRKEGCPVAVHIDKFIESCEKLKHLIALFHENKRVNLNNVAKGERLQKILIATAGYEHVPILRMVSKSNPTSASQ
jgi:hypothetical protein